MVKQFGAVYILSYHTTRYLSTPTLCSSSTWKNGCNNAKSTDNRHIIPPGYDIKCTAICALNGGLRQVEVSTRETRECHIRNSTSMRTASVTAWNQGTIKWIVCHRLCVMYCETFPVLLLRNQPTWLYHGWILFMFHLRDICPSSGVS